MALTIYDIAKKANVSIATVSRVLNNKGGVSPKTKAKILQVLEEEDYTPSQVARGLAGQTTHTIGILAMDIRELHHSNITYYAEQALSYQQYSCIVSSLGGSYAKLGMYLDMMESRTVDGLILIGSIFADERCVNEFRKRDLSIPCVVINAVIDLPNFYSINSDDAIACANAVEYLAGKGRRRIALVHNDDTQADRLKRRGYNEGMQRMGLHKYVHEIIADPSIEGGFQAVEYCMQVEPLTDGFLFTKDYLAAGGIHALHKIGYRIPEDVALVGVNNSIISQVTYPALTSIDYRAQECGEAAVQLLSQMLEGVEAPRITVVPCRLIERDTT